MLPLLAMLLAATPAGALFILTRRGLALMVENAAMAREAAERQAKREAAERWAAWRPHRPVMPCHDGGHASGNASIMGGCE